MKISKSKGKLKVGDWVRTNGDGIDKMKTWIEGEIGEIGKDCFYIWQNDRAGVWGDLKPASKGYKYSHFIFFKNPNEIEIKEKPTKEVEDFANTIKDNPQEIIDWARSEIKEYNELIDIVRKKLKE